MHNMDIDNYVNKLENVIRKKLMMYASLKRKVQRFKYFYFDFEIIIFFQRQALKDEEVTAKNMKTTFYY